MAEQKKAGKGRKRAEKKTEKKADDVKKRIFTLDNALDRLEEALEKKDEGEILDVIKTIETAAAKEAVEKESHAEPPEEQIPIAVAESGDNAMEKERSKINLMDIRSPGDVIEYFSNLSNEEICCYGTVFIVVSLVIIATVLKHLGYQYTLLVIAALVFISYRLRLWRL